MINIESRFEGDLFTTLVIIIISSKIQEYTGSKNRCPFFLRLSRICQTILLRATFSKSKQKNKLTNPSKNWKLCLYILKYSVSENYVTNRKLNSEINAWDIVPNFQHCYNQSKHIFLLNFEKNPTSRFWAKTTPRKVVNLSKIDQMKQWQSWPSIPNYLQDRR